MKCSECLSNRESDIIRIYIDHMKFVAFMAVYCFFLYHIPSCSFGSSFYHCIYGCMFFTVLFNFVGYVFSLLC